MSPVRLSRLRSPIDAALRYSPAQAVYRQTVHGRLAVLAYHGVGDAEAFDEQLRFLARRTHPVSLGHLLRALRHGHVLPQNAVLLTFDDADPSLLETGVPLLGARGIPSVAFVVAGLLDTDEPFWFDEARDLVAAGTTTPELAGLTPGAVVGRLKRMSDAARRSTLARLREAASAPAPRRRQLRAVDLPMLEAAGVAVGNHTMTHPCLDRCDAGAVDYEIVEAHCRLARALGHEPTAFAYPNGDWDAGVVQQVAAAGYEMAFVFDHRLSPWPPRDPLRVSRLRGGASDSVNRLAITISGLHPAVHSRRR